MQTVGPLLHFNINKGERHRVYGTFVYISPEFAMLAVKKLHKITFYDRELIVKYQTEIKEENP